MALLCGWLYEDARILKSSLVVADIGLPYAAWLSFRSEEDIFTVRRRAGEVWGVGRWLRPS